MSHHKFTSNQEVIEYLENNELPHLDSTHSQHHKLMVATYKAIGFDANRWWVLTPSSWCCPSCSRSKSEIVRLNKHNYLEGHIHEHHDHIHHLVKSQFTKTSEQLNSQLATENSTHFIDKIFHAFSAFPETLICKDCNLIDAEAKKLIKAPTFFSFSPSEISSFIISRPNLAHKLDDKKLHETWSKAEKTYNQRLEIINLITEIAAKNEQWYQFNKDTSKRYEASSNYALNAYGLTDLNPVAPETLLYDPVKYDQSNFSSWRLKISNRYNKPPTGGEINNVIAMTSKRHWQFVNDDWVCPICNRSKISCVRKSNKQEKWHFTISTSKLFFDLTSNKPSIKLTVCNDCNTTATNIGTEAVKRAFRKLESPSRLLTASELKKSVIPREHNEHKIDNQYVDSLISVLIDRIHLIPE